MFNWIYNLIERRRILALAKLPFALIRELKENISGSIYGTLLNTEKDFIRVLELFNKYKVNLAEEAACYFHKNEHGVVETFERPLFTPGQVSAMRSKRRSYRIGLIVFILLETLFFYMIAANLSGGVGELLENFGPGAARYKDLIYLSIAFLFAVVSGYMLDSGLSKVYAYIYAKEHYKEKEITKSAFHSVVLEFILGITLIVGVVSILVVMNIARAKAIDDGGSETHNGVLVWALIVTSIFVGIWIGIGKKTLSKLSPLLALNDKWESIKKELQEIHNEATKRTQNIYHTEALAREKCYQLALNTQEILGIEYDERDSEILKRYREEMNEGKFQLTDLNFWRNSNLSTNERQLMEHSFSTHKRLRQIMEDVGRIEEEICNSEKARLNSLTQTNSPLKTEEEQIEEDKDVEASIKELVN